MRLRSPSASSMKSRSFLCRFSTKASRPDRSPSTFSRMQGTVSMPAITAARSRLSPATSSKVLGPVFRTVRGCRMP